MFKLKINIFVYPAVITKESALAKKNQKRGGDVPSGTSTCPEDLSHHHDMIHNEEEELVQQHHHHNKENRVQLVHLQDGLESNCYMDLDQKTSLNLTMDSPESRPTCFGQINGKSGMYHTLSTCPQFIQ